jgi:putative copper resistance protein D
MLQLLDIFGFLSVVLRGLTLALQSLVGGGLVFLIAVERGVAGAAAARSCRRLLLASAVALAVTAAGYVAADTAILMGTTGLALNEVVGANFFVAGAAACLLALAIALLIGTLRPPATAPAGGQAAPPLQPAPYAGGPAQPPARHASWRLETALLLWLGVLATAVATSHSAARLEGRLLPLTLTALHQSATAVWIGGLPYLLLALPRAASDGAARLVASRFSRLAQGGVAVLVAAGAGLAYLYVGSPTAILGTAYGAMVATKVVLLALLLGLGALNYRIVHGLREGEEGPAPGAGGLLARLRRFGEAEIGIGFTVILAAASLTSQPPAADLTRDQVPLAVIGARLTPRPPRLLPPGRQEAVAPGVRAAAAANGGSIPDTYVSYVPGQISEPPTPGEKALSEFNHNVSGLVVLLAGLLAVAARAGWRWARNWPLAFLLLGVFLFLLADVEYWPLGPVPFWRGFLVAEALQHRFAVLLIVAFAIFERQVQTGRARVAATALVFPFVCFLGGALLLTHSHSLNNPREELLAELSHASIAILGIAAGWSRWLELRLDGGPRRALSWVWPVCLMLVGAVLLNYRES